jgi:hypothetical protein
VAERGRGPRPDILRQSHPTPCVRRARTSRVTAFEVSWSTARSVLAVRGGLRSDERTFAAIAYHLTQDDVVSVAAVPLIYAAAMAASALAALGSGWLFDRTKGGALLGLPLLVSAVPVLAFVGTPLIAIVGALLWGRGRWSARLHR